MKSRRTHSFAHPFEKPPAVLEWDHDNHPPPEGPEEKGWQIIQIQNNAAYIRRSSNQTHNPEWLSLCFELELALWQGTFLTYRGLLVHGCNVLTGTTRTRSAPSRLAGSTPMAPGTCRMNGVFSWIQYLALLPQISGRTGAGAPYGMAV